MVGVLGAMVWALENPDRGMVEPDDLDYRRVLDIADPYLGDIVGQYPLDAAEGRVAVQGGRGSVGSLAVQVFASFDMDIG